jgi:hypothetical protein
VKDALNCKILEMSTSLALAEFSELHIVHAWRLFGESHFRSLRTGIRMPKWTRWWQRKPANENTGSTSL